MPKAEHDNTPIADDYAGIAASMRDADTEKDADTEDDEEPIGEMENPFRALLGMENPLLGMENPLRDLLASTYLIGHLAVSDRPAGEIELSQIEDSLLATHTSLESLWQQAFNKWREVRRAHEAELAAERAAHEATKVAKAAPGSPEAIRHAEWLYGVLRRCAQITLEECEKAEVRTTAT